MTDEERTPKQADEQAQGTQAAQDQANEQTDAQQDQAEGQGLLSRLAGVAKSAVSTVAETAKDVAETVAERAPSVVENVIGAATHITGREHTHAKDGSVVETDEHGEPVAEQQEPATQGDSSSVVASVTETAQSAAATVSETAQSAAETVAETAQSAAQAVRRVGGRVYDAVTAAVSSEQPTAEGGETETAGASYEPTEGAGKGGRPRRFKDVQGGMQLEGKVTSIALYGVFVDVGVGRDGLVHISEMSETRVESPTDLVKIGDPVQVWVKSVDPDQRRISLTMRDPNRPKPQRERRGPRKSEVDREKLASLSANDNIEGVISSLAPFGAFVDIGVGKDGLVHISELAEGRVDKPEDAVQVGERYTFKVLEADPEGKRISLSLRRAQRTARMQQLEPGTIMDGTVSGIAPFGAFVDVGVGRDGLVHISELSAERVNTVEEAVTTGDKVQVKVIEVDPKSKRISLTMRVEEPLPNDRERPAGRVGSAYSSGPELPEPSYTPSFGGGEVGGESRGGFRSGDARGGAGRGDSRGGAGRGEGRGGDSRGGAGRGRRDDRDGGRGSNRLGGRPEAAGRFNRRDAQIFEPAEEVYTFEDPEEENFSGDATLEDLMSKFNAGKDRSRDKRRDEEEEEEGGGNRSRRDAIRRTLAMQDEE